MLNLSLRAVFRKESWMFCAGLLLSIADLLKFFDLLQPASSAETSRQVQINSMFLATSAPGTRGVSLPLRVPVSQGRSAWQVAASTIRPPTALFNRESVETSFLSQCKDLRSRSPIPLRRAVVYNPRRGRFAPA